MLVWSGWGFLVPVTAFGCLLATEAGVEAIMEDDDYYQSHGWPMMVGFLVAGILVWFIGRMLSRKPGRTLVDRETGEQFSVGGDHSFMFIPIKWWPPICVVLGLVCSFMIG